jgi:glycosyltransferase involved in cell wall biosynthesis
MLRPATIRENWYGSHMSRRVLIAHNRYQLAGGEDRVVEAEADMLRSQGHEVFLYTDDNDRIAGMAKIDAVIETVWSRSSYRKLAEMIEDHRIELCHFHNTFPLISPAAYYAACRAGAAVVQTLHNYRLLCPGALLMREGRVCETCVGRTILWPGVIHRCYRHSYATSAVAAMAISAHNLMRTWSRKVNRYIALGEFGRQKFIEGGLPSEKIVVKPNFVHPDPGIGEGRGGYALFVGRLSPEKGLTTLLEAWNRHQELPVLRIAGGGPLASLVHSATQMNPRVQWLGEITRAETLEQMRSARFLICPSIWYECFALVVIEAFACGLPVIASSLGALPELIRPEYTGLLFKPGSAEDLSAKVQWALQNESQMEKMRHYAREEYEAHYTAQRNYQIISATYDEAIAQMRAPIVRTRPAAA